MRKPRAVVVAFRNDENLCFMFKAPESLGVDDAVSVPLEARAYGTRFDLYFPSLRFRAETRILR